MPVNGLYLDSAQLQKLLIFLFGNLAVNELDERLNNLLYTVNAVAGNRVDCVQHRKDNLEGAEPCIVGGIFDNGNHAEKVILLLDNNPRLDLEIFILGVNTIGLLTISVHGVGNAHQRLAAYPIAVHNESGAGVEGVNLERDFIFLGFIIRQNHSIARPANQLPLNDFPVEAGLVLKEHHLV